MALLRFFGKNILLAVSVVVLLGFAGKGASQDLSDFSSVNLWNGGLGGYATYRIPGIIVTRRGTVLVYGAARRTLRSDWADADIVMRRSTDGGRTFAPSVRIAGEGKGTTDNPVAIADTQTGAVYMLYQTNYERVYFMESDNDGMSFSAPREITDVLASIRGEFDWNVVAPGPTHGIQLRNSRIVVPVWLANGATSANGHRAHSPSAVTTVYSDDHGRTWHHGDIVLANDADMTGPSETVAAELLDGSVMLSIRTASEHHRRVISISKDGATHWSRPQYDEALFEPVCNAGLVRYPAHDGTPAALLFSNPDTEAVQAVKRHYPRQRLTVRASFDEGKTWPVAKTIDFGSAEYSDLAVLRDGTILVFYESGAIDGKEGDPAHLTLARFDMQWLRRGDALPPQK
jgi:sialidase-1